MIAVNFSTLEPKVAQYQATLLENLTDNQDIPIFQLMDDLSEASEFTQNHIKKDRNPLFTQINHSGKDYQNEAFESKLEINNQIVLRNGTHSKRQGKQFGGLIATAALFIPKFLASNIISLFTNLIKGGKHNIAFKFAQNVIPHTPISNTHAHTSIRNHIWDKNSH